MKSKFTWVSLHIFGVMNRMEVGDVEFLDASMCGATHEKAVNNICNHKGRFIKRYYPSRVYRVRSVDDGIIAIARSA